MKYYIKHLIYNVPYIIHKEHPEPTTTCSFTIIFTDFNTDFEKIELGDVYYYVNEDFKNLKVKRFDKTSLFYQSHVFKVAVDKIKSEFNFKLNDKQLLKLKRKGWLQTQEDKTINDFAIRGITFLPYPDKLSINEYLELKGIYWKIKSSNGKYLKLPNKIYFFMNSLIDYYLNNCDYQTNIQFINKIIKSYEVIANQLNKLKVI